MRSRTALLATTLTLSLLSAGCEDQPERPWGYWEGKGRAHEILMRNDNREMFRAADVEFWFVLGKDDVLTGEAEITYQAELHIHLPSANVGLVSVAPSVGGRLTDRDPRRRYPIAGIHQDGRIYLDLVTPESEREPLEFTLRAEVSGGGGASTAAGASFSVSTSAPRGSAAERHMSSTRTIPMRPFSPFLAKDDKDGADLTKRADGPFDLRFEAKTDTYSIDWSARQVRESRDRPALDRQIEDAILRIRQAVTPR